jgi:hypothetical protein
VKYTVTFLIHEGHYSFDLVTDFVFETENEVEALTIAGSWESLLLPYLSVKYDIKKEDIDVEIKENKYFTNAYLENFNFYDETKGEYLREEIEGFILYPICNPACDVKVTKEEFKNIIKNNLFPALRNQGYSKGYISFECNAYGFKKIV